MDTAPPLFSGFDACMPIQAVTVWFQDLFTSPSGVLCSLRSRYYCAIGLGTYLGFEVGAPVFPRDFQRTVLKRLGITRLLTSTGLSPSMVLRSRRLRVRKGGCAPVCNSTFPLGFPGGFGLPYTAFDRLYSRYLIDFFSSAY